MSNLTCIAGRMPPVRGEVELSVPLMKYTWFRVGGPAEALFRPADEKDLADCLALLPEDIPVTIMGVASNLLVRDGGVPGVVIKLGREFQDISVDGETVTAGAGALDIQVARACKEKGLAGLEFLSGVPGTIGGALRMNAGAYGHEVKDVLVSADAINRAGERKTFSLDELGFTYRHCAISQEWIFVSGTFRGIPGDPDAIGRHMDDIQSKREESQPIRTRTGGSTFRNPAGHSAWQLVDAAGCRGLKIGGAQVSEKHTNFLVNTGDATAADIEALGEEVRRRVKEDSGIELSWEIRHIGVPAEEGDG